LLDHDAWNRVVGQVGVVVQIAAQILLTFFQREGHIELGGAVIDFQWAEIEIARHQGYLLHLLKIKHNLEERCAAHIPFWLQCFHQHIERQILMSVTIQCRLSHVFQKLNKGGII